MRTPTACSTPRTTATCRRATPKLAGCPLVKRKLTLTDQEGLFDGYVSVSSPGTDLVTVAYRRCLFEGTVTIYEAKERWRRQEGRQQRGELGLDGRRRRSATATTTRA